MFYNGHKCHLGHRVSILRPHNTGCLQGGWAGGEGPGSRRVGHRILRAQSFALFLLSRAQHFALFGVFLWNFWWCLKRWSRHTCALVLLWVILCEPGFHKMAQRTQTRTFEGVGASTKIQREDTQREKKKMKCWAGDGKKRTKFWAFLRRAVLGRGRAVQAEGGMGPG